MMAEQRERIGERRGAEQAPRPHAWRVRAEQAYGELSPEPSLTLSASEIGAYAFCPQAWFLQRCRLPLTAETEARRQAGSRAHREIGLQTDVVRAVGVLQRVLLVAAGVLVLVLLAVVWRGLL